MIDLHVHTTSSDGQYSPTQIIEKAKEKNLKAIAITDHDTISGLQEGIEASKINHISFVPGVELNINNSSGEFHLLGLGLNRFSASLIELLNNLVKNREYRNEMVIQKFLDEGISISIDEMKEDFPNTVLGRPHFAYELVKKGVVKTRQQAFDIYLARGRKCYVERIGSNLDEAIQAIKDSGGLPIVAHPMSLYLSWGKLPDVLQNYYERGVVGIEAFHPGARVSECLRLEELANKIGFLVTAGSDFHGEKIRSDRRIGHTCGGKRIDDEIWDKLKEKVFYIHN